MSARCEPPEELRGVDGWHWVQIADWPATVNRWVWDAHEGIGFWHPHISERTRYVSPVATPDELTRLRAELAAAREALRAAGAAMEALHPDAAGDMSDADYARLWNATHEAIRAALGDPA